MDTETGMYYLMSRYYDPVTHRFLNVDGYFQTGLGILDANMNAYCKNNPIMNCDPSGNCPTHKDWYQPTCVICNPAYADALEKHNKKTSKNSKPIGAGIYSTGYYNTEYNPYWLPVSIYYGGGESVSSTQSGYLNLYANYYNSKIDDSKIGVSFQNIVVLDISLGIDDTGVLIGFENEDTVYALSASLSIRDHRLKIGWDTCTSADNNNIMKEGGIAVDVFLIAGLLGVYDYGSNTSRNPAPSPVY